MPLPSPITSKGTIRLSGLEISDVSKVKYSSVLGAIEAVSPSKERYPFVVSSTPADDSEQLTLTCELDLDSITNLEKGEWQIVVNGELEDLLGNSLPADIELLSYLLDIPPVVDPPTPTTTVYDGLAEGTNILMTLSGQSNWRGEPLNTAYTGPRPTKTQVWKNSAWELYTPEHSTYVTPMHPTLALVLKFEERYPDLQLYIIEDGRGGNGFEAGAGRFGPAGDERLALEQKITAGVNNLKAAGDFYIACFSWFQGEHDAVKTAWANAYQAQLSDLFADIDTAMGVDALKLVTRTHSNAPGSGLNTVRAAQVALADHIINIDGYDTLADRLHFPVDTYRLIGEDYLDYLEDQQPLLVEQEVPTPATVAGVSVDFTARTTFPTDWSAKAVNTSVSTAGLTVSPDPAGDWRTSLVTSPDIDWSTDNKITVHFKGLLRESAVGIAVDPDTWLTDGAKSISTIWSSLYVARGAVENFSDMDVSLTYRAEFVVGPNDVSLTLDQQTRTDTYTPVSAHTLAGVAADYANAKLFIDPKNQAVTVLSTAQSKVATPLAAPSIEAIPDFTVVADGTEFSYTPVNAGGAVASWTGNNLPTGWAVDPEYGTLTGIQDTAGTSATGEITATNATGSDTETFSITITPQPTSERAWLPSDIPGAIWFDFSTDTAEDRTGQNITVTYAETPTFKTIGGQRAIEANNNRGLLSQKAAIVGSAAAFDILDNTKNISIWCSDHPGKTTRDYVFIRNDVDYTLSIDGTAGRTGSMRWNAQASVTGDNINAGVSLADQGKPATFYQDFNQTAEVGSLLSDATDTRGKMIAVTDEVFFTEVVTVADQDKLFGYLMHKIGIESEIPAGHPYKDAAPTVEEATPTPEPEPEPDPTNAWTPASESSLKLWLDHEKGVTTTAAGVTDWENQGALGGSFSTTTAALPTQSADAIALNNTPMQMASRLGIATNPALTVAMVMKPLANADPRILAIGSPASDSVRGSIRFSASTSEISFRYENGNAIYLLNTAQDYGIFLGHRGAGQNYGGDSGANLNGVPLARTSSASPDTMPTSTNNVMNLCKPECNVALKELVIFENNSLEVRQKVEGYLAHKQALAALLPAGHPYKDAAPLVAPAPDPMPAGINADFTTLGYYPSDWETVDASTSVSASGLTITPGTIGNWRTSLALSPTFDLSAGTFTADIKGLVRESAVGLAADPANWLTADATSLSIIWNSFYQGNQNIGTFDTLNSATTYRLIYQIAGADVAITLQSKAGETYSDIGTQTLVGEAANFSAVRFFVDSKNQNVTVLSTSQVVT